MKMNRTPKHSHVFARSLSGFTLLEMVVSLVSASIIFGGMTSSIYIASQAFRHDTGGGAEIVKAGSVLSQLDGDLSQAIQFTELSANAATFTVPDRNGDSKPETIRYAWGGTPGNSLTYTINGVTPGILARDVQSFNLTAVTRTMIAPQLILPPPPGGNKVLFVVVNPASLTSKEADRKTLLESWNYTVALIDDGDSQSNYDSALLENDVVYITSGASNSALGSKLTDASIGVVNENRLIASNLGLVTDSFDTVSGTSFDVKTTSHYITETFSQGGLTILTTSDTLHAKDDDLAPGIVGLGTRTGNFSFMELALIAKGGALTQGRTAAGRRVQLPWGASAFDITRLNDNGRTILQRSLEWGGGAGEDYPGPIAHWKLDDASGNSAVDSAGGNNGTLKNGPAWASGQIDGALEFDGNNDYIDITSMNPRSYIDFTICAWYKSKDKSVDDDQYIYEHEDNAVNGITFGPTDDGSNSDKLRLTISRVGASWNSHYSTTDVVDKKWHHLVGVRANGRIKLYVDGVLERDGTDAHAGKTITINGDGPFIGDWPGHTEQLKGLLDDVRLYDRALSPEEVSTLFNGDEEESASLPWFPPLFQWGN